MPAILVLVGSVSGTDKKVLSLFKVFGGGIVELLLAISTEHQSQKRTALACCRSPVSLLTNLLHLVKDFLLDNGRMGVVENNSIFFGIFPLLFVPNGIDFYIKRGVAIHSPSSVISDSSSAAFCSIMCLSFLSKVSVPS